MANSVHGTCRKEVLLYGFLWVPKLIVDDIVLLLQSLDISRLGLDDILAAAIRRLSENAFYWPIPDALR